MPVADLPALASPAAVVIPPTQDTVWSPVVVVPGDSVWALAQKHHTTVSEVVRRNALAHGGSRIHPGQSLLLPVAGSAAPSTPAAPAPSAPPAATPAPAPGATTYTVVRGDTLGAIAARYRTTVGAIASANRITNTRLIYPGQKLVIGGTAAPAPSAPAPSAPAPSAPAPSTPSVLTRDQTADLIRRTAIQYGVDPRLALAIGYQESGWNQAARSHVGAVGTMQIMPIAARWASQLAGRPLDTTKVEENVLAGVLIIKALIASADNLDQAIGGYYQGLPSVKSRGFYRDTYRYVASVKALRERM